MLKGFIKDFMPWILFYIFMGPTHDQLTIAIIIACITFILFEKESLKQGFVLSWGSAIFFMWLAIIVIIFKSDWIVKNVNIISNASLSLIALISILIHKPFTIQYAKKEVAEDKWQHPLFIRINYLLTSFWSLMFLICLGISIIRSAYPNFYPNTLNLFSYIPSIIGALFTKWFPKWYRDKKIIL